MNEKYEPGIYPVKYICIDDGARYPEDAVEIKTVYRLMTRMASHFHRLVAEKCAEHYHHANEGSWADAWPKTFELYTEGNVICRYKITREPVFFAQITEEGEPA